jgi:hypothetical protein
MFKKKRLLPALIMAFTICLGSISPVAAYDYYDDDYYYDDDDYYNDGYYNDGYYNDDDDYDYNTPADMTGVTLDKTSATKYVSSAYGYYYSSFEFTLVPGSSALPADYDAYTLNYTSSNSSIEVYADMEYGAKILLETYGTGQTTVTLTINDKVFTVTLNIIKVGINKTSLLLATKKTAQLKTTGITSGVKWSSTNSKVVKVSSSGKITAKKNGNAVIKAVIKTDEGDFTMGCAVSVVSPKRYKAVKKGISIAKTGTYSQAKRMQKGYYDCSSLVWRAYKYAGTSLMSSKYAPVAADLGKWIVQKKKTVKGGLSYENVQSMKLNAGDLMFETGSSNGRYKGIYHVEMITGYSCIGFDSDGTPELELTWASRSDGAYGFSSDYLVGRP